MIVKIYALIWGLGIAVAGLFYLTGNLTPMIQVIFGFLTFGTVFMGMLSVLPLITHEEQHPQPPPPSIKIR